MFSGMLSPQAPPLIDRPVPLPSLPISKNAGTMSLENPVSRSALGPNESMSTRMMYVPRKAAFIRESSRLFASAVHGAHHVAQSSRKGFFFWVAAFVISTWIAATMPSEPTLMSAMANSRGPLLVAIGSIEDADADADELGPDFRPHARSASRRSIPPRATESAERIP